MLYKLYAVRNGRFVRWDGTYTDVMQGHTLFRADDLFDLPKMFHPALALLSAALREPWGKAPLRTATLEGIGVMDERVDCTDIYIEYDHYLKLKGD